MSPWGRRGGICFPAASRRVIVREESPLQAEVAALLRESDAVAALLYPGEYRRPLNLGTLSAPGIRLFVARGEDGAAAGCCALFEGGDGTAELKRMIVGAAHRGRGAGAALLRGVEEAAPRLGLRLIRLEVGIRNIGAQGLYRRMGYRDRGPFAPYEASPLSLFLEKALS